MDDFVSVSLGSEFEDRGFLINSSLSFISVQSLSSARGSTPLTKRRRYYDATKPMENEYEVPISRLKCLHGLHKCGLVKVGNNDTDTKTRRAIDDYLQNTPRTAAGITRPRKEFPSLRSRSKTVSSLRSKQLEQYFQKGVSLARRNERGVKSVSFALPSTLKPDHVIVKRPIVTVLQHNIEKSITRPTSDKLLLRRPTTKHTSSIGVNDDAFISLAKSVTLKPLNFRTSNDQIIFYTNNFPLLLDAHGEEKNSMRNRTPTPEMRNSPEIKREMKLTTRLNQLETSLDTLDKETEDVSFKTVLRDDEFYPNRWPWNEKKSSDREMVPSPMAS